MELDFSKIGDLWVAQCEVNDDYNVHVECEFLSDIIVNQKTSGDEYAEVEVYRKKRTIDDDFDSLVYPKQIKITSTAEPTLGIITEV